MYDYVCLFLSYQKMARAANNLEAYFPEILKLHWGESNILCTSANSKNSKETKKLDRR